MKMHQRMNKREGAGSRRKALGDGGESRDFYEGISLEIN